MTLHRYVGPGTRPKHLNLNPIANPEHPSISTHVPLPHGEIAGSTKSYRLTGSACLPPKILIIASPLVTIGDCCSGTPVSALGDCADSRCLLGQLGAVFRLISIQPCYYLQRALEHPDRTLVANKLNFVFFKTA